MQAAGMRVDLYGSIHKAQRFHLFRLSNDIGGADCNDATEIESLFARLEKMLDHLRDHARNEEVYIHPLFNEIGVAAGSIAEEHDELESEIRDLERILEERLWDDLYPRYTTFLGRYLLHLRAEEVAQRDELWPSFDDEALRTVLNRFRAERPVEATCADFEFILPALNVPELVCMFRGMKTAAGAAFETSCASASRVLDASKWAQLRSRLVAEALWHTEV
jgi:hypothetical protein